MQTANSTTIIHTIHMPTKQQSYLCESITIATSDYWISYHKIIALSEQ